MAKILAFDQSLNLAYATDRPLQGDTPMAFVHRLPSDGEDFGAAFEAAEQVVRGAIDLHAPDEVWFESPILIRGEGAFTTAATIRILFGLCAIIELTARRLEIPYFEVNNMSWKKFFSGSGHAKKKDTQARCAQLGWGKLDNNCADACGIWAWAKACSDDSFAASLAPLFDGAPA